MNSQAILGLLFWLALLAVLFTFPGYPLVIRAAARLRRRPLRKADPPAWPGLACVVVAHDEERAILQRLRNLAEADYPASQLEIVVVSDGSTDRTVAEARRLGDARVTVIALPQRQGKAAGLNAGVAAARGEIVVFADARQTFAPEALRELARNFSDPAVGAVSGNYSIDPPAEGVGEGVDAYWRLEKSIRLAESRYDSSIGCTGAIYAIRRALFKPLPTPSWTTWSSRWRSRGKGIG
jgi:cellulose synthase/poly-beta-1,6-N-acetylglucosamine synthase-like glycosyltransferase